MNETINTLDTIPASPAVVAASLEAHKEIFVQTDEDTGANDKEVVTLH